MGLRSGKILAHDSFVFIPRSCDQCSRPGEQAEAQQAPDRRQETPEQPGAGAAPGDHPSAAAGPPGLRTDR